MMTIFKLLQQPVFATRSPFATTTRRPIYRLNMMPMREFALESTKFCVDPESSSARCTVPQMATKTCIVQPVRSCIPVRAAMDMVGSVSTCPCSVTSSSASRTSIMKSCLHFCLWPLVKNSSQWKHLLSLRHYAISAGERRRTEADLLVLAGVPVEEDVGIVPGSDVVLAAARLAPHADD
jgi:hypothetical protein